MSNNYLNCLIVPDINLLFCFFGAQAYKLILPCNQFMSCFFVATNNRVVDIYFLMTGKHIVVRLLLPWGRTEENFVHGIFVPSPLVILV